MKVTHASGGALQGLRVVDLSRVLAGPFSTQLLGDLGAEVIKVEPVTGDDTRLWGPSGEDGVSPYYAGLNRNKRHLSLDLSGADGQEVLFALLEHADVLFENFKTGTMDKWGIGYSVLADRFPRLVHCQITGFGATGPMANYKGYDNVVQAFTGMMDMTGEPGAGPGKVPLPVVDVTTGILACSGVLAALYARERTGRGQKIDVSLLNTAMSMLHPATANYFATGEEPERIGSAHPNIAPYQIFQGSDAPIFIAVGNDRDFATLCTFIESPELVSDPRFATNLDRVANRAQLTIELERKLSRMQVEPLSQNLISAGITCSVVQSLARAVEHPQVLDQEMVVELEGRRMIGVPIKMSEHPPVLASGPKARGADTRAVLAELGYDPGRIEALLDAGIAHAATDSCESRGGASTLA